jgi:hypothetical protein
VLRTKRTKRGRIFLSKEIEVEGIERREPDKRLASAAPDPQVIERSRRVAHEGPDGPKLSGSGDSWISNTESFHPSRRLDLRAKGYGIAAGYEKPYKRDAPRDTSVRGDSYGPIPHSGYYGAGEARTPFKIGQAGFKEELEWYKRQYGRETSGYDNKEKSG